MQLTRYIQIFRLIFLSLAFSSLSGCIAKFSTSPYRGLDPGKLQKGVAYKLPRTQIEYDFYLALYRASGGTRQTPFYFVWLDEKRYEAEKEVISLTPKTVGDDQSVFVINTKDLAKFNVWTKKSGFTLGEDGVLQAVNAEFDDRTAEIIKNSVSATLRFAKLAANPIGIATGRSADDSAAPKVEYVIPVKISGVFDYRDIAARSNGKQAVSYTVPSRQIVEQVAVAIGIDTKVNIPGVSISFPSTINFDQLTTSDALAALEQRPFPIPRKYSGVVVRQPNAMIADISIGGGTVATEGIFIADAGPTTLVPFSSQVFTTRSQSAKMHVSGGIKDFSFSTTSAGEEATGTLNDVAGTVGTEVPNIIQAEQTRSDNRYGTTTEIASKSAEIRSLNSEISQIDRKLERLSEEDRTLNSQVPPDGLSDEELASWRAANTEKRREISEEKKELQQERKLKVNSLNQAGIDLQYLEDKLARQ